MSRADKLLDIVFQAKNDQQGRGHQTVHHGTSSPEKLRQKVLQVLHPVSTWTCGATEEIFRNTVCQELVQVSDEQFELNCNSPPVHLLMGADEMAHDVSNEAATGLATVVEVEEVQECSYLVSETSTSSQSYENENLETLVCQEPNDEFSVLVINPVQSDTESGSRPTSFIQLEPNDYVSTMEDSVEVPCVEDNSIIFSDEDHDSDRDPDYCPNNDSSDKQVGNLNQNSSKRERSTRGNKRIVKGDTRKKRDDRKLSKNGGQEYVTKSGKKVPARKSTPLKWCRMKCKEKVDQYREGLFKDYWGLGDSRKRAAYLASLMSLKETESHRPRTLDPNKHHFRQVTVSYRVQINGSDVKICKNCFCQIFDESKKFLEIIIGKKRASISGMIGNEDMRGMHSPRNKTSEERLKLAREHLESIPSYESHYSRRDSSKKYLPPHYTIGLCYKEYEKKCGKDAVNEKIYSKLFHEMKLSIKSPNKDTCQTCDRLHMEINMSRTDDDKIRIKEKLSSHQDLADAAYKAKAYDRSLSKTDPTKKTITFDLQQCLPTPYLQSSLCFYKRQLWVFNLTIHDCDDGQAYCFMWNETVAARGGNEIASCIYKYLLSLDPNIKHLTMFSDTCGGQNRNSHFSIMCMVALQNSPTLETISHKFLIPGHTHLECDSDHSIIEKFKKKYSAPIEHPRDWIQLVRVARQKKPFVVYEMKREDFLSFSGLLKNPLQIRKVDEEKNKVNWRDIRWLFYEKGNTGKFQLKTTLEEPTPFRTLDFRRRGRMEMPLGPLLAYDGPVPITPEKKKDLLSLLPFISEIFRDFYTNLKTSTKTRNTLPDVADQEDNGE